MINTSNNGGGSGSSGGSGSGGEEGNINVVKRREELNLLNPVQREEETMVDEEEAMMDEEEAMIRELQERLEEQTTSERVQEISKRTVEKKRRGEEKESRVNKRTTKEKNNEGEKSTRSGTKKQSVRRGSTKSDTKSGTKNSSKNSTKSGTKSGDTKSGTNNKSSITKMNSKTLFSMTFRDLNILKALINILKEFVDVIEIKVTKEGLNIQTIDKLSILMVIVVITKNDLKNYQYRREESVTLNTHSLHRILSIMNSGEEVTLSSEENDDEHLYISDGKKHFSLRLLRTPEEQEPYGEMEHSSKQVHFDSSYLREICKNYKSLRAEYVAITIEENNYVQFSIKLDELNASEKILLKGSSQKSTNNNVNNVNNVDNDNVNDNVNMHSRMTKQVNLKYLNEISKTKQISPQVYIDLDEGSNSATPLTITYRLEGTRVNTRRESESTPYSYIKYYLAPVNEEEIDN